MNVKLFADCADVAQMIELAKRPDIKGFTTNPTLMHKAGVPDYRAFARLALDYVVDRPISFEVFADDFVEMERQAREITTWGQNVYVKIPITNTKGQMTCELVRHLTGDEIQVNITAVMTLQQVAQIIPSLSHCVPAYISMFAGRIADTGRDPVSRMRIALEWLRDELPQTELIWASPREVLNVIQADQMGCHIITCTPDILAKLHLLGKGLAAHSLDTVKMFYEDAQKAGLSL